MRLSPLPLLRFPTLYPLTSALCRSTISYRLSHSVGLAVPSPIGISVPLIPPRGLFYYSEEESGRFLRNVSTYLPDYTAPQSSRPQSYLLLSLRDVSSTDRNIGTNIYAYLLKELALNVMKYSSMQVNSSQRG
jgi:hypothetical protein